MEINSLKRTGIKISGSVSIKLIIISVLALVLLIPTAMVKTLIHEREMRHEEAIISPSAIK